MSKINRNSDIWIAVKTVKKDRAATQSTKNSETYDLTYGIFESGSIQVIKAARPPQCWVKFEAQNIRQLLGVHITCNRGYVYANFVVWVYLNLNKQAFSSFIIWHQVMSGTDDMGRILIKHWTGIRLRSGKGLTKLRTNFWSYIVSPR